MISTAEAIARLESNGRKFSDEQRLILETYGGIALLAVAGSGKTFTMTNLIAKRLMTGEINAAYEILCTTFSKGGAEEFEGRLNALLTAHNLPKVKVSTIHAACYKTLTTFGVDCSNILSEGRAFALLREAAKSVRKGLGRMEQEELEQLASTISLQMNSLMSDQDLINSSKWVLEMDLADYVAIKQAYVMLKKNSGAIDFDDMLHFVYEWLCVQKYEPVIQWCRRTWRYLFVDEFQDTNPIQLGIIQAILGEDNPADRLVVVGDDDQCIYEWRGTDPRILINICGYFDLKKRYLTTNYRCPEVVVHRAGMCVKNMFEREDKSMISNKAGGSVEIIDITPKKEYKWKNPICIGSANVAERILAQVNGAEGVCLEKAICVLTRNNATMRILANMLYAQGVAVKGQKSMQISQCLEWKTLASILRLVDKTCMITNVDDIMWRLIPRSSGTIAKGVSSMLLECGCSLDWALEHWLEYMYSERIFIRPSKRAIIDGNPQFKGGRQASVKTLSSLAYETRRLNIFADDIVNVINALRVDNENEAICRLIVCYRHTCEFMNKTARKARLFDAMCEYFLHLAGSYGYKGLKQFMKATEQFENGDYALDKKVELRTIHGAKGGEWDTVYILMDDNLEFPNIEAISRLIENEIDALSIERYIDSERRLHYVAQTRASRRLYIVAEPKILSDFALESFGLMGGNSQIATQAKLRLPYGVEKLSGEILDNIIPAWGTKENNGTPTEEVKEPCDVDEALRKQLAKDIKEQEELPFV